MEAGNVPTPDKDFVSKEKRETFIERATSPSSITALPECPFSISLSASSSIEHETASSNKQILEIIVFISIFLYLFVQLPYS
ncbi:hypothetical protein [Parabacteroides distasonis]|uniref:hypothetical protein n=1 Tax=Parabacteroides distasonis TaxID=823 RepID=UPI001C3C4F29|nr:hypothetical protein [Parabacteroides distasonis]